MNFDPLIHHRRSIRLKDYDYSQPGAYFITRATQDRVKLFGEITDGMVRLNRLGEIIRSTWLRLSKFFPLGFDEWVIMPNHMHAIIWLLDSRKGEASAVASNGDPKSISADASPQHRPIGTRASSLGAIIQNFKSISGRNIHKYFKEARTGEALTLYRVKNALDASPQHVWQRNYYEHIVRNQSELDRIRLYIIDNPRRWAEDPEYKE